MVTFIASIIILPIFFSHIIIGVILTCHVGNLDSTLKKIIFILDLRGKKFCCDNRIYNWPITHCHVKLSRDCTKDVTWNSLDIPNHRRGLLLTHPSIHLLSFRNTIQLRASANTPHQNDVVNGDDRLKFDAYLCLIPPSGLCSCLPKKTRVQLLHA